MEVLTDHFLAHRQQLEQAAAAAAAAGGGGEEGADDEAAAAAVPDVTRAMVFITYREQVNLVWQHLRQLEPAIICRCVLGHASSWVVFIEQLGGCILQDATVSGGVCGSKLSSGCGAPTVCWSSSCLQGDEATAWCW